MTNARLPIVHPLTRAYAISLVIGFLMAGISLASLLFPEKIYPDIEARNSFISNDIVNLFIGLPILLGSMWLARRGRLVGLLFWPGASLFILYNYVAYIAGSQFGVAFLFYFILVLLCASVIFDILRSIDHHSVKTTLSGAVPVRFAGWVLILFGVGYFLRAIGMVFQAFTNQAAIPLAEFSTSVADIALSLVMFAGGVLLLKQMPLGFSTGLSLLFAANMLFFGLIIYFLLQPLLAGSEFLTVDALVVAVMWAVFLIPFILYLRGTLRRGLKI